MTIKVYAEPRFADEYVEIGTLDIDNPSKRTPLFYLKPHECDDLVREINRSAGKVRRDAEDHR